jgi:hypothetical protein
MLTGFSRKESPNMVNPDPEVQVTDVSAPIPEAEE